MRIWPNISSTTACPDIQWSPRAIRRSAARPAPARWHRAKTRAQVAGAKDGYVATDFVVAAAEKAGFKLDAKSEINANPKDTKDHPFGVWTLPPSARTRPHSEGAAASDPAFDRSKYDAIGESDRMTLKFRKPGAA